MLSLFKLWEFLWYENAYGIINFSNRFHLIAIFWPKSKSNPRFSNSSQHPNFKICFLFYLFQENFESSHRLSLILYHCSSWFLSFSFEIFLNNFQNLLSKKFFNLLFLPLFQLYTCTAHCQLTEIIMTIKKLIDQKKFKDCKTAKNFYCLQTCVHVPKLWRSAENLNKIAGWSESEWTNFCQGCSSGKFI